MGIAKSGHRPRALLLAYGNPLRGDDGVSWHIAEAARNRKAAVEIEIVTTIQLLPEMAEALSRCELVVFIDASATTAPGTVSLQRIAAVASAENSLTHHLDANGLIYLAKHLYGKVPARVFVLTVGAESFPLSQEISEAARQAIPIALEKLEELLECANADVQI